MGPILLIGGALALLVFLKPGIKPPPPVIAKKQPGSGTPGFSPSGAGNALRGLSSVVGQGIGGGAGNIVRTGGQLAGGIADIVSQFTGRGTTPNVASSLSPLQGQSGSLAPLNDNNYVLLSSINPDPNATNSIDPAFGIDTTSYVDPLTADPVASYDPTQGV